MKRLFEEYGDVMLSATISIIIVLLFIGAIITTLLNQNIKILGENTVQSITYKAQGKIGIRTFKAKDILIKQGEEINYLDRIEAMNNRGDYGENDEDIRSYVTIYNQIDNNEIGEKEIVYALRYNGQTQFLKAKLIVIGEEDENNN